LNIEYLRSAFSPSRKLCELEAAGSIKKTINETLAAIRGVSPNSKEIVSQQDAREIDPCID
jgi:hypothetical protein